MLPKFKISILLLVFIYTIGTIGVSAFSIDNEVARNVKGIIKGNIVMMIGQNKVFVDRIGENMDKSPSISEDEIFVPSSFVTDVLGRDSISNEEMIALDVITQKLNKKVTLKSNLIILSDQSSVVANMADVTVDTIKLLFGIYVAKNGDDKNSGLENSPLATLDGAKSKVRSLIRIGLIYTGGLNVYIREGNFQFSKEPFVLGAGDSGRDDAVITYCAYKNEEVSFIGGINIDTSTATKVSDKAILDRLPKEAQNEIMQINVFEQGFEALGNVVFLNEWSNDPSMTEIFFNDRVMTNARWPNDDYVLTGEIIDAGSSSGFMLDPPGGNFRGGTFKYSDLRHERWSQAKEIWLHGLWYFDWSDKSVKAKIDPVKKEVKLLDSTAFGVGAKKRYYAFNLLEELDIPGEWFIDKDTKMLYLYPPSQLEGSKIEISTLAAPIINFNNASNIHIEGIKIGVGRTNAIEITNSKNILVESCIIRNVGRLAVKMEGGFNNGVVGCDIYETGMGGIHINAGNKTNLIPSGSYADNNKIHRYSRNIKTMSFGVRLLGVGNKATHNMIYDAPHMGIYFAGNDHLMEYNEIYNVVKDTIDAGAVYAGRDYTFRGNMFRYNYLHDINSVVTDAGGTTVHGFYLDDAMSSCAAYGNIFYNVKSGALFGGGNDIKIENNIFIDNPSTGLFDDRGMNWMEKHLIPGGSIYESLYAAPFKSALWRKKYPELAEIEKFPFGVPHGNVYSKNVSVNSGAMKFHNGVLTDLNRIDNNYDTKNDPGFVDRANKNFNLRSDSEIFTKVKDFSNIPFDEIGLYDIGKTAANLDLGNFNLLYPLDGQSKVNGKNTTLRWEISEGSDLYKIQIAKDTDFNNIIIDKELATTSYKITDLNFNQTYYWRVYGYTNSKFSEGMTMLSNTVRSFSTSKTEIIDKTPLFQIISETKDLLKIAKENATPDENEKNDINEMSKTLTSVQNLFAKRDLKQSDIDKAIVDIKIASDNYYKGRSYGIANMSDLLKDEKGWDMAPGVGMFANSWLMFSDPENKKNHLIGYKHAIPADKVLRFKTKMSLGDEGFQGFATRSKLYDKILWDGANSGYLVVIKKDQFELQKYNDGHKMLEIKPNNGILVSDEECDVEFGAVNIGKMVKIILKVNGVSIFEFMDEEVPLKEEGYFVGYEFTSGFIKDATLSFGPN